MARRTRFQIGQGIRSDAAWPISTYAQTDEHANEEEESEIVVKALVLAGRKGADPSFRTHALRGIARSVDCRPR